MEIFIITAIISFVFLAGAALIINYCKTTPASDKHQLTGMCHKTGGQVCCSCSDLANLKKQA